MFNLSTSESRAPGTVGHVTAVDHTCVEVGKNYNGLRDSIAENVKGIQRCMGHSGQTDEIGTLFAYQMGYYTGTVGREIHY